MAEVGNQEERMGKPMVWLLRRWPVFWQWRKALLVWLVSFFLV